MTCRVLLADDHVIVREGLKNILLQEGFEIAGEASDGKRAVELAKGIRPDIALIDFSMPVLNGIDAAREIHGLLLQTKTILLTMYKEEQYVLEALRAGIKGYVLKTQAGVDLVRAIRAILQTVESHRRNIMTKLNIHETAGLVRHAIKIGLIQP